MKKQTFVVGRLYEMEKRHATLQFLVSEWLAFGLAVLVSAIDRMETLGMNRRMAQLSLAICAIIPFVFGIVAYHVH